MFKSGPRLCQHSVRSSNRMSMLQTARTALYQQSPVEKQAAGVLYALKTYRNGNGGACGGEGLRKVTSTLGPSPGLTAADLPPLSAARLVMLQQKLLPFMCLQASTASRYHDACDSTVAKQSCCECQACTAALLLMPRGTWRALAGCTALTAAVACCAAGLKACKWCCFAQGLDAQLGAAQAVSAS